MTDRPYYLSIIRLKNFHGIHVKTERAFCKFSMHEFLFGISDTIIKTSTIVIFTEATDDYHAEN